MPNKSVGDLTPFEAEMLRRAQSELRHAALATALAASQGLSRSIWDDELFLAARRFDAVCNHIGFQDYWKTEP